MHSRVVYRRRSRAPFAFAALAVAVALGAVAAWALIERGRIPAGTTIAGVDVGGQSRDDARELLDRRARALAAAPIALHAEGLRDSTTGRELGARPLLDDALDEALDAGFLGRVGARLGLGEDRSIGLAFHLNPARVESVASRLDTELGSPAKDARVVLDPPEADIRVVASKTGLAVDRRALRRALRTLPRTAPIVVGTLQPRIETEEAERARAVVEELVSEPRSVALRTTSATLWPSALRRLARVESDGDALVVVLEPELLAKRLRPKFRKLERPARDASFRIEGTRARVVPARDGRLLDGERIARSLTSNLTSTVHRARFATVKPAFSTAEAEKLGIVERVSEFTTYYPCCAPRVLNIKRAAELLDGTVLPPKARFSMNDALGKRTEEKGFVMAPQIYNGVFNDAVGGGISQVATTLYNAAFFAGLRLDAHSPHQFYISRYPMGREATVSWGGPELVFTNNWPAGLLVKVRATDTSITVRMYSTRLGRRVKTETGKPFAYRAPTTRVTQVSTLPPGSRNVVQEQGDSGFSVTYTRRVFRGKKLLKREHWTVRYDPQNGIVEVGPPKKAPPKKPPPDAGAGTPPAEETPPAETTPPPTDTAPADGTTTQPAQ